MPYNNKLERRRRARLKYRTDDGARRDALKRAAEQRQRVKDSPAYRERWRTWQRRSRRAKAQGTPGDFQHCEEFGP